VETSAGGRSTETSSTSLNSARAGVAPEATAMNKSVKPPDPRFSSGRESSTIAVPFRVAAT
jgi:hypothetical protein